MKSFLGVLFLCVLSAALVKSEMTKEEMLAKFNEYANECVTKEGASQADIQDMMNKKPAASKAAKCLRACMIEKAKMMDASMKIDKSVAMEHSKMLTKGDPEKMKIATTIVDKCSAIAVPADRCEAAEAYGKCFKEEAMAHGVEIKV